MSLFASVTDFKSRQRASKVGLELMKFSRRRKYSLWLRKAKKLRKHLDIDKCKPLVKQKAMQKRLKEAYRHPRTIYCLALLMQAKLAV